MSQRSVENKVEGSQHLSLGSFLPILICGFFSLLACFCFWSLRLTLKACSVRSCCSVLVSVWPRSPWAVCFPKVGQSPRGQELVGELGEPRSFHPLAFPPQAVRPQRQPWKLAPRTSTNMKGQFDVSKPTDSR